MPDLPEMDQEFLDELSRKAINDDHVQVLLEVISELNTALHEKREVSPNYQPMLALAMAAYGALQVDVIRFVAGVKPSQ